MDYHCYSETKCPSNSATLYPLWFQFKDKACNKLPILNNLSAVSVKLMMTHLLHGISLNSAQS